MRLCAKFSGLQVRPTGRMIVLIFLLAALLFFGNAGRARAEGNIHIGKLQIDPFLSITETFTDNVFFTFADRRRDSFITYLPGLKLEFPFGRQKAEFQYFVTANRYRVYEGENTTNHTASGLVDLKLGRAFEVRLTDIWTKGNEPRTASSTGLVENFRSNTGAVALVYELATRSKVEFNFSKSTWNYIESSFRDRDDQLVSGYLYYRFLPKTSAFIEFDRTVAAYDRTTALDNTMDNGLVGLTWQATERSRGTIKAGVQKKGFDSALVGNYRGSVASLDVAHNFTPSLSLSLVGQRTAGEPKVEGTRYLVTTAAAGEISVSILSKLAVILRGSYGTEKFSDPIPGDVITRQDRSQMGGTGLKLTVRDWLMLESTYGHRKRISNISVNNYRENFYTLTAGAAF